MQQVCRLRPIILASAILAYCRITFRLCAVSVPNRHNVMAESRTVRAITSRLCMASVDVNNAE